MSCTSMLHAIPNGPQNDTNTIRLICAPEMMDLGSYWAAHYGLRVPDASIQVVPQQEVDMQHALLEPGALGLVSREAMEIPGESLRILPMGRELIVPVISSRHPALDEIMKTGISPPAFARDYQLVCGRKVAEEYLDVFLPQGFVSGKHVMVSGTEEMVDYLSRDPAAVGFCPLADLNAWEDKLQAKELILVPIDADGNGKLDHLEDIYRSPSQLVRGAWIGKYPRTLSRTMYVVTRPGALAEGELAFLDWLSLEGQERLAVKGFTAITSEELRGIKEELAHVPPSGIPLDAEAAAGKVLWIVLGFLLVLVLLFFSVPRLFQRWAVGEDQQSVAPQEALTGTPAGAPGGFFFDKSHTWAFLDKDGKVRVGIDEFLQNVTGPITRVVMKQPGEKVRKGDTLLKLVQRGKQLEIKSPVSGMVVERNDELLSDSSAINRDPYDEGWVCRVEPSDWMKDLAGLFRGDGYRAWVTAELVRLKQFFCSELDAAGKEMAVPVMQDGGEIKPHVLEEMEPEIWEEFQTRFINASFKMNNNQ